MDSKKRIDRLALMIWLAVLESLSEAEVALLDGLGEIENRRLAAEIFEKVKIEIETYEAAIKRHVIEPSSN